MALKVISCEHLESIEVNFSINEKVCKKCIESGDQWVHLRMCLDCGNISCCDSSKNKHATKHFEESRHATMVSAEEGERWAWCYLDEKIKKY